MATAKRFARAVGMAWTDDRAYGKFRGPRGATPAVWMVSTAAGDTGVALYHVDAGGDYVCYARTPVDSARQTGPEELSSEEAMERAARAVEATGITRDQFALRVLALECDPPSGVQRWRVEWERVIDGERVGTLGTVLLSAESGAVLQVMTGGRHEMPADLAIDRQEAIRLALEAGAEALGTPRVEIEGLPELRLVLPNDPLSLYQEDSKRSPAHRMAWEAVVATQRGERRMSHLWVDASDGSLLGHRAYERGETIIEERRARRDLGTERTAQPANAASGYLVAAVVGIGAVAIIVLVLVWPRRQRVVSGDL